jgi:broad specificity phosphatase PhoE
MSHKALAFLLSVFVFLAPSAHAQGLIFLVRHADRASSGPDSLLSKVGEERAQCLANMMKDANIKAVFATEFKRTQQTAAPLAAEFHLQPKIVGRDDTAGLVKQLKANKSYPVLVVTHSETLPVIARELGAGVISQPGVMEYDDLILIPVNDGKAQPAVRMHYCFRPTDAAAPDR